MGIERFFIQDVTIRRAPLAESRYHDQLPDWTNATDTAVKGWFAEAAARGATTTKEVHGSRDATVLGAVLFLPADTDIRSEDRVVVEGRTFEVDGIPTVANTPRGSHHIEAALLAIEG